MTERAESQGWLMHPDRRRFSLRREGDVLQALRCGEVACSRPVMNDDPTSARRLLAADIAALPSIYAPEPLPPIIDAIDRARLLAADVLRYDALVIELAEVRGRILAGMGAPLETLTAHPKDNS